MAAEYRYSKFKAKFALSVRTRQRNSKYVRPDFEFTNEEKAALENHDRRNVPEALLKGWDYAGETLEANAFQQYGRDGFGDLREGREDSIDPKKCVVLGKMDFWVLGRHCCYSLALTADSYLCSTMN